MHHTSLMAFSSATKHANFANIIGHPSRKNTPTLMSEPCSLLKNSLDKIILYKCDMPVGSSSMRVVLTATTSNHASSVLNAAGLSSKKLQ